MMCDGHIYFTRRMVIALAKLADPEINKQDIFDQVVIEIQRSVDFYESQLGKGGIAKIILLPPSVDLGLGFDYIEQNISTDIEIISPLEILGFEHDGHTKDEGFCLAALGAALEGPLDV